MTRTVVIAAYGTLRSGEANAHFVRNAISRRFATIPGTLYDTGFGYPAYVSEGEQLVVVELIEIPFFDWPDVDRLEEYPLLYDRKLLTFMQEDGLSAEAWIYMMNHLPDQAAPIPSGNWKAR